MNQTKIEQSARVAKDVLNVANREGHLAVLAAIVQGKRTYEAIQEAVGCNYKKVGDAVHAWKGVGLVESRKTGGKHRELWPVNDAGIAGKVIAVVFEA